MSPEDVSALRAFLIACGEGCVPWLYLDQRKDANGNPAPVVTSAIGCAIWTLADCMKLDWTTTRKTRPSYGEIQDAWQAVRSRPDLATHGGGAFSDLTSIRLTPSGLDALVAQRANDFEYELRPQFANYDTAPQAARVGLLRLAWATGAKNFDAPGRWPAFSRAFRASNWHASPGSCADECRIPSLDRDEPARNGQPSANDRLAILFRSCDQFG